MRAACSPIAITGISAFRASAYPIAAARRSAIGMAIAMAFTKSRRTPSSGCSVCRTRSVKGRSPTRLVIALARTGSPARSRVASAGRSAAAARRWCTWESSCVASAGEYSWATVAPEGSTAASAGSEAESGRPTAESESATRRPKSSYTWTRCPEKRNSATACAAAVSRWRWWLYSSSKTWWKARVVASRSRSLRSRVRSPRKRAVAVAKAARTAASATVCQAVRRKRIERSERVGWIGIVQLPGSFPKRYPAPRRVWMRGASCPSSIFLRSRLI